MTFAPRAEPGFYVSRVPVKSLKQVYAVLEVRGPSYDTSTDLGRRIEPLTPNKQVLRDQVPISQFLRTVAWEPQYDHHRSRNESYVSIHAGIGHGDDEEVDLDSLLNGTPTDGKSLTSVC